MKKSYLFAALVCGAMASTVLLSNDADTARAPGRAYEIGLRSRRFVPAPGIGDETLETLGAGAAKALAGGESRIHTLVQLDTVPSPGRREQLARQGVELLTYIPEYAWLASVPAEGPERALSLSGVRWAGELSAHDKLQPRLMNGTHGAWACDEDTGINVVLVQFFKDVSLAEGAEVVASHGGEVLDEASLINTLVVKLHARELTALAGEDVVEWIEQPLPPLVAINAENRAIVGADTLQSAPYDLDGSGVDLLIYDGGRAYSHSDLVSHMTYGDTAPFSEHATHVACTACGDGTVTYNQRGMAPGATVLSMGFEFDYTGIFLYTNPGDIQADLDYAKNSWGPSADLLNASIGTNTAWNGFPCSYEGNYGATSQLLDSIARGSLGEPFIMAWANGNERGGRCGSGYLTTAPPACAKNPIQSGATQDDDSMSSFSSWGPTDDGRLKPVICAPGVNVLSCNSSNGYTTKSGTSMASPTTAGIIALMLEQYRNSYATGGEFLPSSAKALLIHTAVDLGSTGPDYQFGYGRIDGVAAVDAVISRDLGEEAVAAQGEVHTYALTVSGGAPELRVSLAWDDPPGSLMAIKKLVNDLDLECIAPDGAVHRPWVLEPDDPSRAAARGIDRVNNQEQVVVSGPAAGSWTVRVTASVLPVSPQPYSIVFSGAGSTNPVVTPGAAPTATPTPHRCSEYVSNGGFESGDTPWIWSGSAKRSSAQAHTGTYSAEAGGTVIGSFYQEITLPADMASATLSYWVRMESDDPFYVWDFFDVEIHDGSGQPLTTLQSLTNADPAYEGVWTRESFLLPSDYAGRTVRLHFQAVVDSLDETFFYVDDVSLDVCIHEPLPTPTPTSTPMPTMPTPTPVPPTPTPFSGALTVWLNKRSYAPGDVFDVDISFSDTVVDWDGYLVITGNGGVWSVAEHGLKSGIHPIAWDAMELHQPFRARVFSLAVPYGVAGDYTIHAAILPTGDAPTIDHARGPWGQYDARDFSVTR